MDRDDALKLLKGGEEGIREWNQRHRPSEAIPDLCGANLMDADLRHADLRRVYLRDADLSGANLMDADLSGADLSNADLNLADLSGAILSFVHLIHADLSDARLRGANLRGADLIGANLSGANFRGANLRGANFRGAILSDANLSGAQLNGCSFRGTFFANVDLSEAQGLESVKHEGPSTIGIDTLFLSEGKIPEPFLRGCGVPDALIVRQRALVGAMEPIQFYSCFISYSTKNEDFAKRLHSNMRDEGLRVWFAPEDVQGGKKLDEQIDKAIRDHDKLLLVLSPESMASEWVKTEIRKARKAELKENRRKLFPIRLVDFATIRDWECFDADSGKDLGAEIREYFIPDFSTWKDHDTFEAAFARLLNDLKAEESTGAKTG